MVNENLEYQVTYLLHYDGHVTVWSFRFSEINVLMLTVADSNHNFTRFPRIGTAVIEFFEGPNFYNDLKGVDYRLHLDDDLSFILTVSRSCKCPEILEGEAGQ